MDRQCYEKLRKAREEKNYTYKAMAQKLDLSVTYYWQLENKKKNLYYNTAVRIAKIFNLKPDDLFYEN